MDTARPSTVVAASAASPPGGDHSAHPTPGRWGWAIVAALAVTQTVGYGVLYYAFAVFLAPIAADLHTSTTHVTGALTASALAGVALAIPVGRWLDRHGGRALMTIGSIAATALLVALAHVHTVTGLYLVLVGIGLAAATVLYEPAFAIVVTWFPPPRRATALLAVTIVAGFASSIFLPVTGLLVDRYGWRTALLVLAAIHGAATIPLHALVLRRAPRPATTAATSGAAPGRAEVRVALADVRFWILGAAFVAHGAALAAFTIHLVAYLTELGHPATFAASIAGLLGVLSVSGRLATTALQRRRSLTTVVAVVFVVQATGAASLALTGHTTLGAIVGVVGFGLGFGVATIARPALLTDFYGTAGYATISGILTAPITLAKAGAPLAAAALRNTTGSYTPVLVAIATACALAAVGLTLAGRCAPAAAALPAGSTRRRSTTTDIPHDTPVGVSTADGQPSHEQTSDNDTLNSWSDLA